MWDEKINLDALTEGQRVAVLRLETDELITAVYIGRVGGGAWGFRVGPEGNDPLTVIREGYGPLRDGRGRPVDVRPFMVRPAMASPAPLPARRRVDEATYRRNWQARRVEYLRRGRRFDTLASEVRTGRLSREALGRGRAYGPRR